MTFGYTVEQTSFDGSKERWGVKDCATREEAYDSAWAFALRDGWTRPKWWQWWRWGDPRPQLSERGDKPL